ncbi:hypothetical protein [Cohaesibacter gelatinilyticus]|uniref:Uncharacterized protein n=1 Tax=Cohaesibacter gelatinilyticus TaxID=372072 RepID=A0A285PGQ9_9HYPH|nr:hypothetical protein [Cohaesibacter gelatinilyticus]SNZ20910.1 hypothetical protein SAMN06265368_4023 [Cohaesibacter gelatinilyticus]
MTISSEINKSGPYVGNGVVIQFDFDFKIDEAAHLHVIRTSVSGVEAVLTENEYQVSLDADRTGSVTLSDPLPTGEKITLLLNPPFNQLVDLPNQGAWNPEVLESALDKLTSCLLKLREEVSRAVKIKASTDLADLDDLLADIERLADVASEVKSLVGVKADIITCAANIAAILAADDEAVNAASSAQTTSNLRDEVATMKQLVEAAKDQAIAARDAAQAANPIPASDKGRELVAKDTAAEMRTVLGAMAVEEVPSGVPVGALIDWPVDAVPAFWARADGSAFSRSTYSDLHDALAPEFTVTITNGSAIMTSIGSAQGFRAGMAIEGAGIPVGTTIQSVDGANQITLSANATANGTKCRVYRYGNGDGSTTFNLPNFAGRVSRTWDPSGAINPDEAALGVSQEDALQGHWHDHFAHGSNIGQGSGGSAINDRTDSTWTQKVTASDGKTSVRTAIADGINGQPRIASETRSKSLIVNKIIKVSGGVDDSGVLAAAGALADIASAVAKADEVERVAKNKVANITNTHATYLAPTWTEAKGVEVAVLSTTIENIAVGNKVKGAVHIFCESENNVTYYITRNGVDLIRGTGGGDNGANGYIATISDVQISNTPSLLSFNFFDEAPGAGENIYKIMTQSSGGSAQTVAINHTISGGTGANAEYGVSSVILEEVQA